MTHLTTNRSALVLLCIALLASWCVGMFARGYWTPDEPREADIAWRMSWQADHAVPLLAGEPFCEKPPLTYWLAGASMRLLGSDDGWAARLPNLLYAILTSGAVAWLARRLAGTLAAAAAAAASATFLLSYQVAIWLASDAPLLAAAALGMAGAAAGFGAQERRERLTGYIVMHAALAAGFLAKSAAGWIVPTLALAMMIVLERRWREVLRWELWIGLPLQALIIGTWVWSVYAGPDGAEHLRVFFWNNLVGRYVHVEAPAALQYTSGHQNSPGKYLLEMPLYLFPWTLLVIAAGVRAWRRHADLRQPDLAAVRWALAGTLPALAVLSIAATARNIYVAPLLPSGALLLGWWAREASRGCTRTDVLALRGTALVLLLAMPVVVAVIFLGGAEGGNTPASVAITVVGAAVGVAFALLAWRAGGERQIRDALLALLLAYCSLLSGPATQAYRSVDRWQDLASVGHALKADLQSAPLMLVGADETTRAWVDMYVSTAVERTAAPPDPAGSERLSAWMKQPGVRYALVQLGGRAVTARLRSLAQSLPLALPAGAEPAPPGWISTSRLHIARLYELPNGRRYALLAGAP